MHHLYACVVSWYKGAHTWECGLVSEKVGKLDFLMWGRRVWFVCFFIFFLLVVLRDFKPLLELYLCYKLPLVGGGYRKKTVGVRAGKQRLAQSENHLRSPVASGEITVPTA